MTRRAVTFHVEGKPEPQGSKMCWCLATHGPTKAHRGRMWEDNEKAMQHWRGLVIDEAIGHRPGWPEKVPVQVNMIFVSKPPPKGMAPGDWCAVAPDLDKLERAVLDGLQQGGLLVNDAQVARVIKEKRFGYQLGLTITVKDPPPAF